MPWIESWKLTGSLPPVPPARGKIFGSPWQRMHVAGRLKWFVRDVGSLEGLMSCFPWQSAHQAALLAGFFAREAAWKLFA